MSVCGWLNISVNIPDARSGPGDNGAFASVVSGSGNIGRQPDAHWGSDGIRAVAFSTELRDLVRRESVAAGARRGVRKHLVQRLKTTVNQVDHQGDQLSGAAALLRPFRVHKIPWQAQLYKCRVCHKCFGNQMLLITHKESHEPVQCRRCLARFASRVARKNHSCPNADKKDCRCTYCNLPFSSPATLFSHYKIHKGEKPHQCSQCFKNFRTSWSLTKHALLHDESRFFPCSICSRRYRTPEGLKKHQHTHSSKEFRQQCPDCKICFRTPSGLVAHLRTHTGEKPYQCNQCTMKFAYQPNLNRHMKVHSDDSAFQCPQCGVRFRHQSTMSTHLRVHQIAE